MYYLLSCEPSFSFVSPVTYVYHVRANSTIQTFSEQHILSKIIIAADAIKHFPSISPSAQKVAVHSAERFRQGALMEFVKHFKDYSVFSKAYKLLRYLHIPAKDFFSSPYCSIASKLRFMNNYIPPAIGCLMNFISIKYILKKSPYKLTYLITNQQMVLSKEFWKHVEHCCAYENSKQNKKAFPFFCKRY